MGRTIIRKKVVNIYGERSRTMKITKYIIAVLILVSIFSINFGSVFAVKCNDTRPDSAPDLFQIDTTKTSAKLYFTPVNNAISGYTIIYGTERGRDDFGVSFPFGTYEGVIDFTINALNPNTKYYFRVRADNGCRQGWMSDTMSATTDLDFKAYTKFKGDSEVQTRNLLEIPAKTEDPSTITQTPEKVYVDTTEPPITEDDIQKKDIRNSIVDFFNLIISKIRSFFN